MTWLVPLSRLLFLASIALYAAVHWSRLGPQPLPGGWTAVLGAAGIFLGVIVVHEALHARPATASTSQDFFGVGASEAPRASN